MLLEMPRLTYSIGEVMKVLKLSRQVVYNEINAGRLKTYKVGRRRFASAEAVRAWIRQREREHGK